MKEEDSKSILTCGLDSNDPNKCNALLDEGRWLDPRTDDGASSYKNWQPPGCMMHKYTKTDIQQCLGGQKVVIAGDSTGRQIFQALAEKAGLTWDDVMHRHVSAAPMHHNMQLHIEDVKVKFVWAPYWDGSALTKELNAFRWNVTAGRDSNSAALFFMRAPGLWLAADFPRFQSAVDKVLGRLEPRDALDRNFDGDHANMFFVSPVQIPAYEILPAGKASVFLPERFTTQNEYVKNSSLSRNIPVIGAHIAMLAGEDSPGKHIKDGVHLTYDVRSAEVDVVLNLNCNAKHAYQGFPHDRTCCMAYKRPEVVQLAIFGTGVVLFLMLCSKWIRALSNSTPIAKASENVRGALILVLTLSFCFVADRTHVFEKVHKQFSLLEFGILVAIFLALGLASIRGIKLSSTKLNHDLFLSREQTDEWKGWMQVLILIYHYTGASPVVEIYKIVRLLVSAYLFLTGYGNTLSLLQKPDFTLRKLTSSVIRLNILSVGLSYMMSTNYLFYYFPALATFWYLVVYTVLAVGYHKNDDIQFLCCKIIIAIFSTTGIVLIPGVMEAVAVIIKVVFRVDWDISEWRFRMTLDLFIVYVGVFGALIRYNQMKYDQEEVGCQGRLLKFKQQIVRHGGKIAAVVMLLLFAGYTLISRTFVDKYAYNRMHPFISWMPILGFIILRNSHSLLRAYHSTLFAWIGQISLETYILQYHIWLAADTKGLLRLGLFNRWVEAALITPVYIWISWSTSNATRVVVKQMISVARLDTSTDEEQGNGYALIAHDNQVDEDDETTKVADPPLVEVPDSPQTKTSKFHPGCLESTRSIYNKVVGDLRWRLMIMFLMLWISNLVADAQIRGVIGLSWMFGEKEE